MLDIERQYYVEHLSELLDHCRDRFVVIKGTEVVGAFDTLDEALREGTRRFGLASFLARRVEQTTPDASVPALTLGLHWPLERYTPEPNMSSRSVQKAVLAELRQYGQPISIRELVARVRQGRPEFRAVADFDFRSAILAMRAIGAIESTPTNQVTARSHSGLAGRG